MASQFFCGILFKIVLPLILVAAFFFRFNGFSFLYLCCFFCIPLLPSPSVRNCQGQGTTVSFLKALIFLSGLASFTQIVFQIILASLSPYGHFLPRCVVLEQILREIGLNRFDRVPGLDICRLLLPDFLILAFSIFCWISARSLSQSRSSSTNEEVPRERNFTISSNIRNYILPYLVLLMLLVSGISLPCLISCVYFLIFLLVGTLWSFHKTLHHHHWAALFRLRLFLMIYSGSHILVLYFYQFQFFQEALPVKSLPARLLGLIGFIETKCDNPQTIHYRSEDLDWPHFVYVGVVLALYWFLATEIRYDNMEEHGASEARRADVDSENAAARNCDAAENDDFEENDIPKLTLKETVFRILSFMMSHSYIASLIIMMAWSIIYHSWLTFVLLLWACIIWITPFARSLCMVTSPFLVLYAEFLLLIQYVYGLSLNDDELPMKSASGELDFEELGFKKWTYPFIHLAIQTLFTWVFWVTLHQHVKEKRKRSEDFQLRPIFIALTQLFTGNAVLRSSPREVNEADDSRSDAVDGTVDVILMRWMKCLLSKYWILLCCGAFLLVGLQNDVSLYQICYMAIFLFLFVCYQVSFSFWRLILRPVWWAMVIYSICILLVIYTYQFENMPMYWRNTTHLSHEWLYDLGLRQHTKASLLLELLTPTAFSVIIVIQLHFFYRPFMEMIDLRLARRQVTILEKEREGSLSIVAPDIAPHDDQDEQQENNDAHFSTTHRKRFIVWYNYITVLLWRLGELHMSKIVSFTLICVVLSQVCAINAVIIVLLAVAMLSRVIQRALSYCFLIWSSLVILAKMCYQLQFVQEDVFQHNCSNLVLRRSKLLNHFSNNALWVGFYKTENISADIQGYLFLVFAIVLQTVVTHHQKLYRRKCGINEPIKGILFPETIELQQADKGLVNMIKYLCNKMFHNFGWEVCVVTIVINMGVRCDALSVVYAFWLGAFLFLGRERSSSVWRIYVLFLAVMLPVQYVLILGWPPGLCTSYPWTTKLDHNLIHWLFLTDPQDPQNAKLLLVDFFQLMLACCQETVFANERTVATNLDMQNDSSRLTLETQGFSRSSSLDFMRNRTWLDLFKIFLFQHIYWITLTIVYITVQSTVSIFNFGFILGCFFFLWHGQSLYLHHKLIVWWKFFLGYNFFVLFLKVCLQLVSCVWIDEVKRYSGCYVLQLLSLYCLRQAGYTYRPLTLAERDCISPDDTGLSMDCACFVFLLLQYRIFTSVYFGFVKRELTEQSEMASCGAKFIDEQLRKNLEALKEKDKVEMSKIKKNVKRLKNKRLLQHRAQEPQSHYEAIYSGDYYLFESEETEVDSDSSSEDSPQHKVDKRSKDDEPTIAVQLTNQPGLSTEDRTSGGEGETVAEDEQSTAEATRGGCGLEKLKSWLLLVLFYGKWILDKMISFLNDVSKDYRAVARQLKKERRESQREPYQSRSREQPSSDSVDDDSVDGKLLSSNGDTVSWTSITTEQVHMVDGPVPNWRLMKFIRALYYALISQTNYLCFLIMIINHVVYASILSMAFPLFIFLWGMLSIPRPTKKFWITVITYTQLVIIVKYIFKFEFIRFNDCSTTVELKKDPLCPARLFEIERDSATSAYDLLLLLALFFHRYALQAHGLWRDKPFERETADATSSSLVESDTGGHVDVNQDVRSDEETIVLDEETSRRQVDGDRLKSKGLCKNIIAFIQRMVDPNVGTGAVDVYGAMFGCQFIIFLIILFSWSAFAETEPSSDTNFAQIIEKNIVPKTFLYMVLTQFVLIMIDRALYLRKYVLGKLFYLVVLVIIFHIFMFLVVPAVTQRRFQDNVPAIFLYLFKCLYFALSAYQVRCGYPTRILGNFLTKNFTMTNVVLFQGIQTIPFVLELRSLLDWVCTDSTLTLFHWLKMEDIYANIYILKCYREAEKTQWFKHERGAQYPSMNKWAVGGFLVFLLILIIWFPLLFMSYINSVYTSNTPTDATFTLTIGGYQPLFKVSAQQQFLKVLSDSEMEFIKSSGRNYEGSTRAQVNTYIENFKVKGNVVLVRVSGNSSSIWTISPPSRKYLVQDLLSNNTNVTLRFQWEFTREPLTALVQETISGMNSIVLSPGDVIRTRLGNMLVDSSSKAQGEITISNLFPTFIRVPASGQASAVTELFNGSYVDCGIKVRVGSVPNVTGEVEWWELTQKTPRPIFDSSQSISDLEVLTFNDYVPPLHFSFFASTGIIGLYVGFVWLVGKFVRLFFTSISYRIMFDELPNVDKVFKLCLDVYMVRETKEFELEEDLFAKLMFLYRSPETLIKWTKFKRE